ncbi:MAG TPA: MarR family transcriptional regulator [Longimicrobiaceae bacterium]|jgi:DNA-binding MarR family transcriptional regulator|nr:MarR family transcriptional regulator [Longimicrobiaceae bacterium]
MQSESSKIQREIKQRQPFRTAAQEATVSLLRTADLVRRRVTQAVEPFGVTVQQFNVLRILRGAGDEPMPTLEVADRMLEQTPGITRLLDRLEAKGLVRRERCPEDRRRVLCWITPQGLDLLRQMDAALDAADDAAIGKLDAAEVRQLITLLDRVREE